MLAKNFADLQEEIKNNNVALDKVQQKLESSDVKNRAVLEAEALHLKHLISCAEQRLGGLSNVRFP